MIYACPTWECAADADRCTPVRELHVAFKISYVYDYMIKLCRTRVQVIRNHVNPNVRFIEQGEVRHRKYKGFKLGGGLACGRSTD
jgi:hypothetical protein